MKMVCVAIALTFLGAAAASAQSVEIGPGGVRFGLYPPPPPLTWLWRLSRSGLWALPHDHSPA